MERMVPNRLARRAVGASRVEDSDDIVLTASLLLRQHGGEAAFIAADRADASFNNGDYKGWAAWIAIGLTIMDLQKPTSQSAQ